MRFIINILLLVIITSFYVLTPAYGEDDDGADDNTARDDTQVYHVYEGIDLISAIKIQYGKPRIVVKAVYPQLESGGMDGGIDNFNKLVMDLVQEEISAYTDLVVQNKPAQQKLPKEKIKNDLYIDYDTSAIRSGNEHIISIRFTMQGYISGVAHPTHYHRVLNYDLDDSEKIELADLFLPNSNYLDVLSSFTESALFRRLANKQMVAEGTQASPNNFKNWNIKSNGLLITFDELQVAPYVNGAQTVLVPYAVLKKIIAPDSPIISCANNRKKCARNNLLTGGFIDEAKKGDIVTDHVFPSVRIASREVKFR